MIRNTGTRPTIGSPTSLEAATDQAIAAFDGDAREAVKALIVANAFLETELEKLRAAASTGYARGQLLPRDRMDGTTKDECFLLPLKST